MKKQIRKQIKDLTAYQVKADQLKNIKGGDDDFLITEDILD